MKEETYDARKDDGERHEYMGKRAEMKMYDLPNTEPRDACS